jgi:DNA-binding MarR family transcriptional regulator
MIQVISTLEREGLIERAPDANHGRILRTKLTPKGRTILAACDRAVTKVENAMLADLSAEQREELLAALLSCVQHLGAGLADV